MLFWLSIEFLAINLSHVAECLKSRVYWYTPSRIQYPDLLKIKGVIASGIIIIIIMMQCRVDRSQQWSGGKSILPVFLNPVTSGVAWVGSSAESAADVSKDRNVHSSPRKFTVFKTRLGIKTPIWPSQPSPQPLKRVDSERLKANYPNYPGSVRLTRKLQKPTNRRFDHSHFRRMTWGCSTITLSEMPE